MKLLLITTDNSSADVLTDIYSKHNITAVVADNALVIDQSSYDLCIIYGSLGNDSFHTAVVEMLVAALAGNDKPLLGVGIGFEVVCRMLGADLSQLGDIDTGTLKVIPTDDGAKLFQGADPLCVTETKRWSVDELPKKLAVLAKSETGIEAVRHKTLPIYALQQLPQDFAYISDAKMVFQNLLSAFKIK